MSEWKIGDSNYLECHSSVLDLSTNIFLFRIFSLYSRDDFQRRKRSLSAIGTHELTVSSFHQIIPNLLWVSTLFCSQARVISLIKLELQVPHKTQHDCFWRSHWWAQWKHSSESSFVVIYGWHLSLINISIYNLCQCQKGGESWGLRLGMHKRIWLHDIFLQGVVCDHIPMHETPPE